MAGPVSTTQPGPWRLLQGLSQGLLQRHLSALILAPTAAATLVFVYGFIAWTAYMSLTGSRMMPLYRLIGFDAYTRLWEMERWHVSIVNLLIWPKPVSCISPVNPMARRRAWGCRWSTT